MSKLTESFKASRVFNPHNFYASEPQVWIHYRAADNGRGGHGPAWQVHHSREKTDPDGHWANHGVRTMGTYFAEGDTPQDRKANVLAQAQAWASERYGVTEWKKDPYGGYGDAEFVARRIAELKAAVKT